MKKILIICSSLMFFGCKTEEVNPQPSCADTQAKVETYFKGDLKNDYSNEQLINNKDFIVMNCGNKVFVNYSGKTLYRLDVDSIIGNNLYAQLYKNGTGYLTMERVGKVKFTSL